MKQQPHLHLARYEGELFLSKFQFLGEPLLYYLQNASLRISQPQYKIEEYGPYLNKSIITFVYQESAFHQKYSLAEDTLCIKVPFCIKAHFHFVLHGQQTFTIFVPHAALLSTLGKAQYLQSNSSPAVMQHIQLQIGYPLIWTLGVKKKIIPVASHGPLINKS